MLMGCQESFDERCAREAREFTAKHCPQPQGEGCRMDSTTFDAATRTIVYHYTLYGPLDEETVRAKVVSGADSLRSMMLVSLKNSISLKEYKERGLNFTYTYASQSMRKTLLTLTFRPADYAGR